MHGTELDINLQSWLWLQRTTVTKNLKRCYCEYKFIHGVYVHMDGMTRLREHLCICWLKLLTDTFDVHSYTETCIWASDG